MSITPNQSPTSDKISIEIASIKHKDGILELIKNVMLVFEPLENVLNFQWDDVKEGWSQLIDDCINERHTHVAINENGEVVGARLSRVFDVSKFPPNYGLYDWLSGPSEKSKAFAMGLNHLSEGWRDMLIKSDNSKSEKLLHFVSLVVRPDYGGRGIAVIMTKENLALAKSSGCDYVTVVATNWMSQRVFEKCGLRTVRTIMYKEYCNDIGEPIFNVTDPKNPCMKWMIMEL